MYLTINTYLSDSIKIPIDAFKKINGNVVKLEIIDAFLSFYSADNKISFEIVTNLQSNTLKITNFGEVSELTNETLLYYKGNSTKSFPLIFDKQDLFLKINLMTLSNYSLLLYILILKNGSLKDIYNKIDLSGETSNIIKLINVFRVDNEETQIKNLDPSFGDLTFKGLDKSKLEKPLFSDDLIINFDEFPFGLVSLRDEILLKYVLRNISKELTSENLNEGVIEFMKSISNNLNIMSNLLIRISEP